MVMSLPPMSFHNARVSTAAPAAGSGGCFDGLSCASASTPVNNNSTMATSGTLARIRFIFQLLGRDFDPSVAPIFLRKDPARSSLALKWRKGRRIVPALPCGVQSKSGRAEARRYVTKRRERWAGKCSPRRRAAFASEEEQNVTQRTRRSGERREHRESRATSVIKFSWLTEGDAIWDPTGASSYLVR